MQLVKRDVSVIRRCLEAVVQSLLDPDQMGEVDEIPVRKSCDFMGETAGRQDALWGGTFHFCAYLSKVLPFHHKRFCHRGHNEEQGQLEGTAQSYHPHLLFWTSCKKRNAIRLSTMISGLSWETTALDVAVYLCLGVKLSVMMKIG